MRNNYFKRIICAIIFVLTFVVSNNVYAEGEADQFYYYWFMIESPNEINSKETSIRGVIERKDTGRRIRVHIGQSVKEMRMQHYTPWSRNFGCIGSTQFSISTYYLTPVKCIEPLTAEELRQMGWSTSADGSFLRSIVRSAAIRKDIPPEEQYSLADDFFLHPINIYGKRLGAALTRMQVMQGEVVRSHSAQAQLVAMATAKVTESAEESATESVEESAMIEVMGDTEASKEEAMGAAIGNARTMASRMARQMAVSTACAKATARVTASAKATTRIRKYAPSHTDSFTGGERSLAHAFGQDSLPEYLQWDEQEQEETGSEEPECEAPEEYPLLFDVGCYINDGFRVLTQGNQGFTIKEMEPFEVIPTVYVAEYPNGSKRVSTH